MYTRKKGLDRDTNKALLLRHIERNAADGSRMAEFKQVLPALGRGQLQALVQELADDGQVHFVGRTNAARWFPGPARPAGEPADCLAVATDAAPSNQ